MDLVNSDARATQLVKQGVKPGALGGKAYKGARLLLRPIIAICNDAFTPSLRTLRPLAEVVAYRKVSPVIVADRLRSVCAAEGLKIDSRLLTQIANESDSDMRSCLNILQFGVNPIDVASTSSRPGEPAKGNTEIAIKDREKSWTSVVNRIFRRQRGFNNKTEESHAVLSDIHSCGEYDRIITSCFTMYPEMQYHDDMLQKPVKFGDWLYFHDMVNRGIYVNQHGTLGEYYGYAPLACYSYFSSYSNVPEGGRNIIVKTGLEHREMKRMNEQLRDEFIQFTSPECRHSFNKSEVSSELLPFLLRLVNPSFEIGGGSLRGKKNEEKMTGIVDILIDYNLSFQTRTVDAERGNTVYHLYPPIETLAVFGETNQLNASVGKYSTRHALFNELQKRKYEARKHEMHWVTKKYKASDPEAQSHRAGAAGGDADHAKRKRKHPAGEDHDEEENEARRPPKPVAVDPFKRFKKAAGPKAGGSAAADGANSETASQVIAAASAKKVWVQFNEGLSNAVRRDVTWRDIWL